MEGLTAKVFRTYNASITLQQQLKELTNRKFYPVRGTDLTLQYRPGFLGLATSLTSVHHFLIALLPVQQKTAEV